MKNKMSHLSTPANTPNFLGIWKMFCSMTGNQPASQPPSQPASQAALNQAFRYSGGKTIWDTQKWKNDVRRLTTQWRHHRRVDVVVIANLEVRFYSEPIFGAQKIEMRSNYLVFSMKEEEWLSAIQRPQKFSQLQQLLTMDGTASFPDSLMVQFSSDQVCFRKYYFFVKRSNISAKKYIWLTHWFIGFDWQIVFEDTLNEHF